jgi:hypothetical protein
MFAATTADDPTAPATFTHPDRPTLSQTSATHAVLDGLINEYERAA